MIPDRVKTILSHSHKPCDDLREIWGFSLPCTCRSPDDWTKGHVKEPGR